MKEENNNTASRIQYYENLQRAAGFDSSGTLYPALFQLLGYRKAIAQLLLGSLSEESRGEFEKIFEYTNCDIKKLLSIS
jgi:hypothetical protein